MYIFIQCYLRVVPILFRIVFTIISENFNVFTFVAQTEVTSQKQGKMLVIFITVFQAHELDKNISVFVTDKTWWKSIKVIYNETFLHFFYF